VTFSIYTTIQYFFYRGDIIIFQIRTVGTTTWADRDDSGTQASASHIWIKKGDCNIE
jgi:hypothetical protein